MGSRAHNFHVICKKESMITESGGQASRINLLEEQTVFTFASREFQLVILVSFDSDENASKEYRPGQQVLIGYIPMSQPISDLVLVLLLVILFSNVQRFVSTLCQ